MLRPVDWPEVLSNMSASIRNSERWSVQRRVFGRALGFQPKNRAAALALSLPSDGSYLGE